MVHGNERARGLHLTGAILPQLWPAGRIAVEPVGSARQLPVFAKLRTARAL